jgi:hypothetical protein
LVLVVNVSYKADSIVLENSFLLEFVPFLLEGVHGFFHVELLQEVSDKVIDNNVSLKHFG